MKPNTSADNMSDGKKVAQALDDFEKIPEEHRKTAYSTIFAFMMGLKLGTGITKQVAANE